MIHISVSRMFIVLKEILFKENLTDISGTVAQDIKNETHDAHRV